MQLLLDARRYTELRERRNELEARRQAVDAELGENERFLYETLSHYELSGCRLRRRRAAAARCLPGI